MDFKRGPGFGERRCNSCSMIISSSAKICPHCRSKQKSQNSWVFWFFAIIFGAVLIAFFFPEFFDAIFG